MESIITSTELIPTSISPNVDSATEQQLTDAITEPWSVHVQAQSIVKKTKADLKAVRTNLAAHLHTMKLLLAKPGRAGGWSSFLTEHNISRTSADRLCAFHEKSLNPDGISTNGAITDDEIAKLAESVWARLEKRVKSPREKYLFFASMITESGIPTEEYDDGVLILIPEPAPEPSVPANTQVIEAL